MRHPADSSPYVCVVQTWVNGAPTVVRRVACDSAESGLAWLRQTGRWQDYGTDHCAYLVTAAGERLATLHIWGWPDTGNYRWRVDTTDALADHLRAS